MVTMTAQQRARAAMRVALVHLARADWLDEVWVRTDQNGGLEVDLAVSHRWHAPGKDYSLISVQVSEFDLAMPDAVWLVSLDEALRVLRTHLEAHRIGITVGSSEVRG